MKMKQKHSTRIKHLAEVIIVDDKLEYVRMLDALQALPVTILI